MMKNFKYIFLSSFLTLLIVSVIFAYFYYQNQDENNNLQNNQTNDNSAQNNDNVEKSTILPVNLRTEANNLISNSRENLITSTVRNVSSTIVGINVTKTQYFRDPYSFFFERIYEKQIPKIFF